MNSLLDKSSIICYNIQATNTLGGILCMLIIRFIDIADNFVRISNQNNNEQVSILNAYNEM